MVTDVRDLGAHFNSTSRRMRGTTLTRRMMEATRSTERVGRIKAQYEKKTTIIRAKMLPKGLYGCKVAPVHENALRSFRGATADALTFISKQRSVDLTFAVASKGEGLDPEVYIFTKRVTA